jgi:predicted nucleic acid-binding protein
MADRRPSSPHQGSGEKPPEVEARDDPEALDGDQEGTPSARATVLVDLNVLLDVLQKREPHYPASAKVWAAIEEGRLRGFIAAHSVTTLFYLLARHLSWSEALDAIRDLLGVFSVAQVDEAVIQEALAFGWQDFEDAVQMAAAAGVEADYLITRNPKDFEGGVISVLQPAEVPAILQTPQA